MTQATPPPVGGDWLTWARQMRAWLAANAPKLTWRDATARAVDNGLMLWDETRSNPVYSLNGDWENVGGVSWVGEWVEGTQYYKGDFGKEGDYSGVALVDTNDHIAPQYTGPEAYYFDGTLADNTASLKQALVGTRYHFTDDREIDGYRIYTTAGQHYVAWLVRDPLGVPTFDVLLDFVAVRDGWQEIAAIDAAIVTEGTTFDLVVQINEPDPTPTTWVGNWNYQTPNNEAVPGAGDILHATRAISEFRINKTDNDGGDRSAELEALTVGDLISGAGVNWAIQNVTDNGTWMNFAIAPQTQGASGVQEFTFSTVTATPITYGNDIDYYAADANVDGLYSTTGAYGDVVTTDTAFITDIITRPIEFSDDWDLLPSGAGDTSSNAYLESLSRQAVAWIQENGDSVVTQTPLPYDAGLWAARGLQDGHEVVTKYGANPDIDIGTGFEVLWNGGDWYTGFDATVADVVTVVSSSANDATGGTGARDVTLSGLDAAGLEIEETITLNGTTPVDSTLSYLRMHRARVGSVGSLDFNDGEITVAQKATPAVVFAVLPAENGSTMISAYTVPAGKTAYITSWFAAFSNLDRGTAIVRLNMRQPSESRRVMEQQSLLADGTSVLPRVYNPPKGPIPAMTDIWISAESDTNNVGLAGGFDLILVDDDV